MLLGVGDSVYQFPQPVFKGRFKTVDHVDPAQIILRCRIDPGGIHLKNDDGQLISAIPGKGCIDFIFDLLGVHGLLIDQHKEHDALSMASKMASAQASSQSLGAYQQLIPLASSTVAICSTIHLEESV